MRRSTIAGAVFCLILFALSPSFAAGTHGTKEEAKALSEKAAALLKTDPKQALTAFQDKNGEFIDRDLYVFVLDKQGTFLAHGAKPALIGKKGMAMKDSNGFEFIRAFLDVTKDGWVDYRWPDPTDGNKIKDKSSYIVRVGDDVVGVGYYKN